MDYGERVAAKLESLIREKGIKRTRLGEILGAKKDASAQWKYIKFQTFLKNIKKSKINFENLQKIADFFGKNIDWFLSDSYSDVLHIDNCNIAVVPLLGNLSTANREWTNNDAIDWISYPFGFDKEQNIFALKIEDDCMYPKICKGDVVFVNPSKMQVDGRIAIVSVNNNNVMRKVIFNGNKVFLMCENRSYPDILLENKDLKIIGLVEHKMSAI